MPTDASSYNNQTAIAAYEQLLDWSELAEQRKDQPMIAPQPGPQEQFLRCAADIAIYGGAAGG